MFHNTRVNRLEDIPVRLFRVYVMFRVFTCRQGISFRCHYKNESVLSKLPLDVVLRILECCDWTWADIPDQDTVLVANHKAGTSQAGMELSEHAVGEDHSANMQRYNMVQKPCG